MVRDWMRIHVPVEFAVAHAKSTGDVVVDLLDSLYQYGYLITLDFTKAFDCLDPLVTHAVLGRLGWGPQLVAVLTAVWRGQRRWVSYQSHTHPLHVERQCSAVPHVLTRVYVDDRSVGVSRAWALSERYHHWSQWSAAVRLCENQAKAVAVASTPARRTTLRRELPNVGVPPFLTPGCLWFAVGLFVPCGGRAPRASRRHGVVSCGRCLLLARALFAAGAAASAAPTSLRCPVGGSSDQSSHTSKRATPGVLQYSD